MPIILRGICLLLSPRRTYCRLGGSSIMSTEPYLLIFCKDALGYRTLQILVILHLYRDKSVDEFGIFGEKGKSIIFAGVKDRG